MQNNKPLVTIITVTFNLVKLKRDKFFRQCLESVYNQTYENIEHIIIDGGSSDGTLEIIKEYAIKGWVEYVSEPDDGIYDAMNKGIEKSKGKYIVFLNSDDYFHGKDGVKNSVNMLEKNKADFSFAPVRIINEDGSKYKNDHPNLDPKISTVFFRMPFCHQTMFTRRDVLIREGMFDTSFKSAGDYDLVLRICLKRYRSVFVNDTFTTFRLGGFSSIDNKKSLDEVAISYFRNYSKLTPITKKECKSIYYQYYDGISPKLAKKLRNYEPYFDYKDYLESKKRGVNYGRKFKELINKIYFKFYFLFCSPKKFFKKYWNKFVNSPLRQPMRRVWYAIRFKKINN